MEKILVCYGGTIQGVKKILEVAKKHAKAFDAMLIIANSIESVTDKNITEIGKIQNHLANVKEDLVKEGIVCETHILVHGVTPGEDLVDFAEENNVDEIIIGVEKKSKVGKLIFGSNAQYVILESKCPVVCVK